jgi:GTP-binding protein
MKQTSDFDTSMDSDQIESERGITILAKNAAVEYKGVKINLIDTPGHADFGGEVERIMGMADACLLLVDAQEGPMPQTKFVLRQALKLGKRVLVCINKVDKPAARCDWVLDTTFELFDALGADDYLCDFPVVYASGFNGVASAEGPDTLEKDLTPLLDMILEECPKPKIANEAPLQMLVSNLDYDQYVGRVSIGKVNSGSLKVGQEVGFQYGPDGEVRKAKVNKLWEFSNNERREVNEVQAGDICAFSGMDDQTIGDTVVDTNAPQALPPIKVEEPTVSMQFGINLSPFAGKFPESKWLTGNNLKARLEKETMTNLAIRVEPGRNSDTFNVKGRGTLQLGILIENMRREGFEMMIGPPQVLTKEDPDTGEKTEPYEEAVVDVPNEFQGTVMDIMNGKGAQMTNMEAGGIADTQILTFEIPTRNMIGMQGAFASKTKGQAILSSRFLKYGPYQGDNVKFRQNGSIEHVGPEGKAMTYQLQRMKDRGKFWIEPTDECYEGMCIGIHNKESDIQVNIVKEKASDNMRNKSATGVASAGPAIKMSIDDFLGHMDTDELLEVTPGPIRMCKKNAKSLKKK